MKILIVDDSERDRKTLRKIIGKQFPECNVIEASDLAGLNKYLWQGDQYYLLFQDISLRREEGKPDSDGLDALYDVITIFHAFQLPFLPGIT